jgi:hypothetical protein
MLVAIIILGVALIAATVGTLGVATVGWLLHRWFDLTQWQGTLIALVVTTGLGFLVYRLIAHVPVSSTWVEDEEWEEDEEEEAYEPPIVPWRRSRPTPGDLPPQKPSQKPPQKPAGGSKRGR